MWRQLRGPSTARPDEPSGSRRRTRASSFAASQRQAEEGRDVQRNAPLAVGATSRLTCTVLPEFVGDVLADGRRAGSRARQARRARRSTRRVWRGARDEDRPDEWRSANINDALMVGEQDRAGDPVRRGCARQLSERDERCGTPSRLRRVVTALHGPETGFGRMAPTAPSVSRAGFEVT